MSAPRAPSPPSLPSLVFSLLDAHRPLHSWVNQNCGFYSWEIVDGFLSKAKVKSDSGDAAAGLVDQLNLEEFADVLDNAPPGTDELVALSKARIGGGKMESCNIV